MESFSWIPRWKRVAASAAPLLLEVWWPYLQLLPSSRRTFGCGAPDRSSGRRQPQSTFPQALLTARDVQGTERGLAPHQSGPSHYCLEVTPDHNCAAEWKPVEVREKRQKKNPKVVLTGFLPLCWAPLFTPLHMFVRDLFILSFTNLIHPSETQSFTNSGP